ncbi:murein transglycosylase A [Proteus mirabilis]|uniref:Murein transglycosylase A n=1 Tax=Proteus mirabilis TaxID=584 RepID=A0A379GCH3_PROMI|nr:murein transglycosylase A [Proteus mirabilis]
MWGGAIKGHHFDIYHGIGKEAGQMAGFYNHYGPCMGIKKIATHLTEPHTVKRLTIYIVILTVK